MKTTDMMPTLAQFVSDVGVAKACNYTFLKAFFDEFGNGGAPAWQRSILLLLAEEGLALKLGTTADSAERQHQRNLAAKLLYEDYGIGRRQAAWGVDAWLAALFPLVPDWPDKQFYQDQLEFVDMRVKALKGDAHAQYFFARMYHFGTGVNIDLVEASAWYRKSAEQGNVKAQCELGDMYSLGQGVVKDDVEAVFWYRKSAEQGHAQAQFNLGLAYENAMGVEHDTSCALSWYTKAADQDLQLAQETLTMMYSIGRGVVQDLELAEFWRRRATDDGYF